MDSRPAFAAAATIPPNKFFLLPLEVWINTRNY